MDRETGTSRRALLSAAAAGVTVPPLTGVASARRDRGDGEDGQGRATADGATTVETGEGWHLADDDGRVVVPHGVNVVHKAPPYLPGYERDGVEGAPFDESDVERIADWGFNAVRLGVIWAGVMPERGQVDREYLARYRELVDLFAEYDIYVLVDMHQDLYSHVFDGDGAPEWAVYGSEYLGELPFRSTSEEAGWQSNYFQPAVAKAFDRFWRDDHDLQGAFASAWQHVVDAVADAENVIGYDLFNEPARGGERSLAAFENRYLQPFYERLVSAVRRVDPQTPIWVEPELTFDFGEPCSLTRLDDDNLAFSYHNYANVAAYFAQEVEKPETVTDLGQANYRTVFENAERAAGRLACPPVLTEFAAEEAPGEVREVVNLAEEYGVGWMVWAYRVEPPWSPRGPAFSHEEGLVMADGDRSENLRHLVRPYPQAVAGTPVSHDYDDATGRFEFRYRPDPTVEAPTVVNVPRARYPDGHDVSVEGGRVVGPRDGEYLRLRAARGATRVDLVVTPR